MRRNFRVVLFVAIICALFGVASIILSRPASAAINPQINFQGKLTNPDGTNVTNGNYSIRFRIYNDPSLDGANACSANSCKWEETQASVAVADGIFRVALGSSTALPGSVDFNSTPLYLGIKVGTDLEMTPRIQLTASPYAFNSDTLDGLDSSNFIKLAGGVQADATTSDSLSINKTNATGNLLTLARGGTTVTSIGNTGDALFQSSAASATAFQVQNASGLQIFDIDTSADASNLITNGSFETNTVGWAPKNGSGTSTLTKVGTGTTLPYAGANSMQTATTGANATNAGASWSRSFTNSTVYTFSLYVKASGANFSTFEIGNSNNNSTDTSCLTAQTAVTTGWTRLSCTFTYTGVTGTSYVYFKQTDAANHTYFIDGVKLEASSVASPYKDSGIALNGVVNTPATFQNQTDSSTAFSVQNSAGATQLYFDNVNNKLVVGDGSSGTSVVLLQLDSKSNNTDPATVVDGAIYYNASLRSFRCGQNGAWLSCLGGLRESNTSVAAGNTLNNPGAGTFADFGGTAAYTIPANDCQPGRVYRLTAQGVYSAGGAAPTLTFRVKLGATVVATSGATTGASSLNMGWRVDFQLICDTTGASGTVEGQGTLQVSTAATTSNRSTIVNTAAVTIDTTVSQALTLGAAFSTANGTNANTVRQFIVEALGP